MKKFWLYILKYFSKDERLIHALNDHHATLIKLNNSLKDYRKLQDEHIALLKERKQTLIDFNTMQKRFLEVAEQNRQLKWKMEAQ